MSDIKLNSQEWCDFIFADKNKTYGAYKLRQSSSKRHIYAFGVTFLLAVLVTVIPMLISEVKRIRAANAPQAIDQVLEMTQMDLEEQVPEENLIKEETAPPPPPLKSTVRFVPPIIAPDEEVADDVEVHTQDDLMESREQISIADVIGDDDEHGIDIAELQEQKVIIEEEPQKIYDFVEQQPSFPGGDAEMMKWLQQNLQYPVVAQEAGIQGRVMVRFVVTKTGDIGDVQVMRGVDPSCDREAVRVVKSMPKWTPGRQNGVAVDVYYNLPVLFRLQN